MVEILAALCACRGERRMRKLAVRAATCEETGCMESRRDRPGVRE